MIIQAILVALTLAGSPYRPLPGDKTVSARSACAKEKQLVERKAAASAPRKGGIGNLPFAMGRRFRTLDEYLVHLKCRAAPIDLPWWQQIRPGVYQHMTTKPGAAREIATRAELMKRFGFSK